MKVTLNTPIQANGQEIAELSFRRLTAGDLRGIKLVVSGDGIAFETDAILTVAARLAGVPPSALDALGLDDFVEVAAQIGPLLSQFPGTGK